MRTHASTSLFSISRCRMTRAARTHVTIRPSATAWWEISTAAAQTITRARPVQSSRTTARLTSVKVTPGESLNFMIYFIIQLEIRAYTFHSNFLTCWLFPPPYFYNPKWLTVAPLLWQPMTPKSGCGTSHPMCAVHTAAASACPPGTSAAPARRDSLAPTATRVSHY